MFQLSDSASNEAPVDSELRPESESSGLIATLSLTCHMHADRGRVPDRDANFALSWAPAVPITATQRP